MDCTSAGGRDVEQPLMCSDILPGKRTNPTSNAIIQDPKWTDHSHTVDIRMLTVGRHWNTGLQLHSLGYLDFEGPGFPASSAFFCFCCIISASLQDTRKEKPTIKILHSQSHLKEKSIQSKKSHFFTELSEEKFKQIYLFRFPIWSIYLSRMKGCVKL